MNHSDFETIHDAASRLLQGLRTQDALREPGVNGTPPDRSKWRQLAEAGWFRLLPEDAGGLGLGVEAVGALFLAIGERLVRGPLLDHAISFPLLRASVDPAKTERLDAALDGKLLLALASAVPGGQANGDLQLTGGRLRGTAELVPFGQWADAIVVVAQEDDSSVLMMVDAAHVRRTPCACVDPCTDYARLDFDDVPVSPADVLLRGQPASEFLYHLTALQRLAVAAEISGCTSEMLAMTLDHAKTRRQFGRPVGSFQALQHLLADMAAQATALHNLVLASLSDASSAPQRLPELGMIAKAYACTVGRQVAQDALQAHGGIGFTAELPLHLYLRRVLTWQGFLGETDDLLVDLGDQALREAVSS